MAAAAVPWIVKGGMALGTYFAGKKAASASTKLSPTETLYGQQAAGQAGQLGQMGQMLGQQGAGYTGQAGGYFSKVLGGDRAQMQEAVAPEARAVTDLYAGAGKQIEQSGMTGPTRDVAQAELSRTQAGKLSDLYAGVRPQAAGALAGLGTSLTGQGVSAQQSSAGLFGNLLGQATQSRLVGQEQANQAGSGAGKMIFDILSSGGGGSKKQALPSSSIGSGMSTSAPTLGGYGQGGW